MKSDRFSVSRYSLRVNLLNYCLLPLASCLLLFEIATGGDNDKTNNLTLIHPPLAMTAINLTVVMSYLFGLRDRSLVKVNHRNSLNSSKEIPNCLRIS